MAAKPKSGIEEILRRLDERYPKSICHLNHSNALELLVGTILAAQCTDARVNQVTPGLFKRYPDVRAFAECDEVELQVQIRSTGFFRNKAKAIHNCCRILLDEHNGEIPADMDILSSLPGVGRKTANVVLGTIFGQPAIIVDTHLMRVTQRLGLTAQKDPVKIEMDLHKKIPESRWTRFSHQIGDHGRQICDARKPRCEECFLGDLCEEYKKRRKV